MTKPWQYAANQFLAATKKSYRLAAILSKAHYAFLQKKVNDFPLDPDWATLCDRYKDVHVPYIAAYDAWVAAGGSLKGNTLSLKKLFKLIPAQLDLWMGMIFPFFAKGSPGFVALFPRDRKPFTTGETDIKISAVNSLTIAIGDNADLAPTKLLVIDAYNELDKARTIQGGGKTSKSTGSETVEDARVAAMNMQYRNMGFLVDKYFETPEKIEPCFDLLNLRTKLQSIFKRKMKVTELSVLIERTFVETDIMRIKAMFNATPTDSVSMYLSSTKGGMDSTAVNVANNHEAKINMSDFGITDYAAHRFLTAVTVSNTKVVELFVELY